MKFKRIAIDTSKHVFTLHGIDEQDRPTLRREFKSCGVSSSAVRLKPSLANKRRPGLSLMPVAARIIGDAC